MLRQSVNAALDGFAINPEVVHQLLLIIWPFSEHEG
jgi:hypothetical protein